MKQRLLFGTVILGLASPVISISADEMEIVIEGGELQESLFPSPAQIDLDLDSTQPLRSTEELLREQPGLSGSRMGGHGIDPVIRGLGQTRINVVLDGASVHGGCPNRMDPPLSFAPVDTYDNLLVLKGTQTVRYQSGISGLILAEREAPEFEPGKPLQATLSAGYRDNSDTVGLSADVATGSERGYIRMIANHEDANSYSDGDGNPVRSAYEQSSGTLMLGYTPDKSTRLEFSAEAERADDLLFAGAGMDAPHADSDIYRLSYEKNLPDGPFQSLSAELFYSEVEHVMDNYTLRDPLNPMMLMRAPSTSDTLGGRVEVEMGDIYAGKWSLGADFEHNDRDAERINDFNGMLNSVLWPGVSIERNSLFAEYARQVSVNDRLIAGVRYDHVSASASSADTDPVGMPMSPAQLYQAYYGSSETDASEDNWGGLLRWEHDLASGLGMTYVSVARAVRTADATERYIASNAMTPDGRWVGNPSLDPEVSHQLELGVALAEGPWSADAAIFYHDVSDFILRDRAHSSDPMLGNATIYRNVDATLYGFELSGTYRFGPNWSAVAGLAYVHATNDTDSRPVAQIPPLEATLTLDYSRDTWGAGARIRAADEQARIDADPLTGSGLDVGATPGWAVLDLYGHYDLSKHIRLEIGVDNLFDETYAMHLNRANSFDPLQVQVNEPGRSAWINLRGTF